MQKTVKPVSISSPMEPTINSSATVNSNSYSVTGLDLSSLGDGSLTITADVGDLAGNSATQASDTSTKDTEAPAPLLPSMTAATVALMQQKMARLPSQEPRLVQKTVKLFPFHLRWNQHDQQLRHRQQQQLFRHRP